MGSTGSSHTSAGRYQVRLEYEGDRVVVFVYWDDRVIGRWVFDRGLRQS